MKTLKKIKLTSDCGTMAWTVDLHEVAHDRACYYSKKDSDNATYEDEYEFTCEDDYEAVDWLQNNMDWYNCRSLKMIMNFEKPLNEVDIDDWEIV